VAASAAPHRIAFSESAAPSMPTTTFRPVTSASPASASP
jgi:hypothetical protein